MKKFVSIGPVIELAYFETRVDILKWRKKYLWLVNIILTPPLPDERCKTVSQFLNPKMQA
jgi:hypothetical protein